VRSRRVARAQPGWGGPTAAVSFAVASRSARDERIRGGDVFEAFVRSDGSASFLLADVSSKGALGMANAETLRRAFLVAAQRTRDPARMLRELNGVRFEAGPDALGTPFASAFVATIGRAASGLLYASAGHEPALIVGGTSRAGRAFRKLEPTGPVLGVLRDATYVECLETFAAGDVLLLATDGFTECRSRRDRSAHFGIAGIVGTLAVPALSVADAVARGADAFTGGSYRDDATVAAIRRRESLRPIRSELYGVTSNAVP
jgi:serine phosphatase RsbU (regulator of sigma subunit)